VDHIIPRRLAPNLELEPSNVQTLLIATRQKTALERGIDTLDWYLDEMKDGRLRFVKIK
jgi:hypothetical protein